MTNRAPGAAAARKMKRSPRIARVKSIPPRVDKDRAGRRPRLTVEQALVARRAMIEAFRAFDDNFRRSIEAAIAPLMNLQIPSHVWRQDFNQLIDVLRMGIAHLKAAEAEKHFHRTPLFAWWAYRETRGVGLPAPDWVLHYFDSAADALLALENKQLKDPASEYAEALGFKRKGRKGKSGRGTAVSRFKKLFDDLDIVEMLDTERYSGTKPYIAPDHVAKRKGVHKATVYRSRASVRSRGK